MTNRLRAMFCDHLGIMRGKYLNASHITDSDTRFARSTFGVHFDRDLLPAPGAMMMEGVPDMELKWKMEAIRDSWDDGTKIVIGDLYDTDSQPLGLCPRSALKRAIADWETHGLSPKVGIELEAFAFVKNEDGNFVPYDNPAGVVYGTGPFSDPLRFNDDIWAMAEKLGFRIDMFTAEYDIPQFEYTLTFDNALKAVDDSILFRLMAREVAFKHGIYLTFMPKPLPEAGGSGMHINFSLWDENGKNASGAPNGQHANGLNDISHGCVSGLVHHHQALAGILAPTVNSYERLQQGSLSGYWANWGGDHRNVTTRVSTETGDKARMEHRMADGSGNTYTAVASVLQAARLGYENKYTLPALETGDGFENTDAKICVASDLGASLDYLEKDRALCSAIGQGLIDNHVFMKRQEVTKCQGLSLDEQRDFYIHFV